MRASSVALSIVCGPIVCAYVVFSACFCPSHLRRRRSHSDDKKRFERRQKIAPRPLPVRPLERSLTLPLPEHVADNTDSDIKAVSSDAGAGTVSKSTPRAQPRTLDQYESRLMALPLELRQMIYRFALGDRNIHIVLKSHKLGHVQCSETSAFPSCPITYDGSHLTPKCLLGKVDSANIWKTSLPSSDSSDACCTILPLLQSCRQVYSEAIEYVYKTNRFVISDLDCLRYFSCTILPRRFDLIQNMRLQWFVSWPIYDVVVQNLLILEPVLYPPHDEASWEETWRIISQMPNLKWLRVDLVHAGGFNEGDCEKRLLEPLKKVTRPGFFQVAVNWEGPEGGDVPFKLLRPPKGMEETEVPGY